MSNTPSHTPSGTPSDIPSAAFVLTDRDGRQPGRRVDRTCLRVYPDPILRRVARPVDRFDGDLATLAADMLATMHDLGGVGLAAPQIGRSIRLFVTCLSDHLAVVVNPETLGRHDPYRPGEGCLSVPGHPDAPLRHQRIDAVWSDLAGRRHAETLTGDAAHIWAHETDHLDGILLFDDLSR